MAFRIFESAATRKHFESPASLALHSIGGDFPVIVVYWIYLDLAALDSVHEFAEKFHKLRLQLDILINNGLKVVFI